MGWDQIISPELFCVIALELLVAKNLKMNIAMRSVNTDVMYVRMPLFPLSTDTNVGKQFIQWHLNFGD